MGATKGERHRGSENEIQLKDRLCPKNKRFGGRGSHFRRVSPAGTFKHVFATVSQDMYSGTSH